MEMVTRRRGRPRKVQSETVAAAPTPERPEAGEPVELPTQMELSPQEAALCYSAIQSAHYAEGAEGVCFFKGGTDVLFERKENGVGHARVIRLPDLIFADVVQVIT